MEQHLPQPLEAEIIDAEGRWNRVTLFAYLGEDRWRAVHADGREITVAADQVLALEQRAAA